MNKSGFKLENGRFNIRDCRNGDIVIENWVWLSCLEISEEEWLVLKIVLWYKIF